MSNIFKEIDIKKWHINIRNLDLNKIKIDENSYKNILIDYIGYVMFKDLEQIKINSHSFISYY